MIAAFTTAAVINYSFCRPEESVQPKDFMPNFVSDRTAEKQPQGTPVTDDELSGYRSQRTHISALLQQYAATGKAHPDLIKMGLVAHG